MSNSQYRPGTLRYVNSAGEEHIAAPGSQWYSTVTMYAQEIWDEQQQKFVKIFEDDDET